MNEMLERMARAAYEQFNIGVESLEPSWDQCTEDFKFRMMEAQKVALKAIWEPTAAMVKAVDDDCNGHGDDPWEWVWKTMIDVIIRDQ